MKEHPIKFNDEMIRAILEGRKTQTRRIPKPSNCLLDGTNRSDWPEAMDWDDVDFNENNEGPILVAARPPHWKKGVWYSVSPRAKAGERLWVAGTKEIIVLEVTDVRFEMLQAISEDEAINEGVDWKKCLTHKTFGQVEYNTSGVNACAMITVDYREGFRRLWNSIYESKGWGWDKNRPVLVYEFGRIK